MSSTPYSASESDSDWATPADILSTFQANPLSALGDFDVNQVTDDYEFVPLLGEAVAIAGSRGLSAGALFASFLAAVSAAIPSNIRLQVNPQQHPDWFESACFWTLLIGPPSSNKSLYLSLAKRPLEKHDEALVREYTEASDAYCLVPKRDRKGAPPVERTLTIDDISPAKLRDVLRDNNHRLFLATDEAATLVGLSSRDRAIFNKAFGGESQKVHRKTSSSTTVRGAYLSILGASHPDIIRKAAARSEQDGFWQRFIPILLGDEASPKAVNTTVSENNYNSYIEAALKIKHDDCDYSYNPDYKIYENEIWLKFSPDAQQKYSQCCDEFDKMSQMGLVIHDFGQHIKKYPRQLARLSLILSIVYELNNGNKSPREWSRIVSESCVDISFKIIKHYLYPQAYTFYDRFFHQIEKNNIQEAAKEILSRNLTIFSATKLRRLKDPHLAIPGLEAANWIRPVRPYAKTFEVNPQVFSLFADKQALLASEREEANRQRAWILNQGRQL